MPGTLHVVATPIGNLEDITRRAAQVLAEVGTIAAEDTRRTGILLRHLGVSGANVIALHDHNEAVVTERLIGQLKAGEDVALVSDAGVPLIADPGFPLIQRCWSERLPVVPIPGASALTALLSVCPIPASQPRFVGFLPAKAQARQNALEDACRRSSATLFLEAPHRVRETLGAIAALAPERSLFVGREMTKRFESYYCGCAGELAAELEAQDALRGEFTLLLSSLDAAPTEESLDEQRLLAALAEELPPAKVARVMTRMFGGLRADHYANAKAAVERSRCKR
ncbi:MAG: 16S rRNA (cytidine(1402)-2'-O)-methyltransferase [Gammaproteobacteria bacterium]|nr:16S rRNA (cytidine(1402)-2'-O)-methyltransferase [Gammaproteobacteria bacterium]